MATARKPSNDPLENAFWLYGTWVGHPSKSGFYWQREIFLAGHAVKRIRAATRNNRDMHIEVLFADDTRKTSTIHLDEEMKKHYSHDELHNFEAASQAILAEVRRTLNNRV